jgi:hypothetical protein
MIPTVAFASGVKARVSVVVLEDAEGSCALFASEALRGRGPSLSTMSRAVSPTATDAAQVISKLCSLMVAALSSIVPATR